MYVTSQNIFYWETAWWRRETGDGTTKNLFDGASENQKRATELLSEIQYGGEFRGVFL